MVLWIIAGLLAVIAALLAKIVSVKSRQEVRLHNVLADLALLVSQGVEAQSEVIWADRRKRFDLLNRIELHTRRISNGQGRDHDPRYEVDEYDPDAPEPEALRY